MKILVACEESQTVCKEFRKKGHECYSCDILPCSGGCPQWHIVSDVLEIINGNCHFKTCDNESHYVEKWDMIIAHPPCTYLCLSGLKHCNINTYGYRALNRLEKQKDAIRFFIKILESDCDKICVENPVGIMSRYYKPTQYVHPLQFGHPTSKKTGLWLKNLPKLKPTKIVEQEFVITESGKKWDKWFFESSLIRDKKERSRFRSKTFNGIAEAMAEQWG